MAEPQITHTRTEHRLTGITNTLVGLFFTLLFMCLITGGVLYFVIERIKGLDTSVLAILGTVLIGGVVGAVVLSNVTSLMVTRKTIDAVANGMDRRNESMQAAILGLANAVQDQQRQMAAYMLGRGQAQGGQSGTGRVARIPAQALLTEPEPDKYSYDYFDNDGKRVTVECEREYVDRFAAMWPQPARDERWQGANDAYTRAAWFFAMMPTPPLEKVGRGWQWRAGVTQEQLTALLSQAEQQ
ncbi:MAG: hypothetical protein IT323_13615 [Anaerolineae bacterium]|nr:hypothetical protein [Anaerolineae bacterium]